MFREPCAYAYTPVQDLRVLFSACAYPAYRDWQHSCTTQALEQISV